MSRATLIALLSTTAATANAVQSPPQRSAAEVAAILAEVPKLGGVLMSPSGEWVVYSVTRKRIATNESTTELLLQRIPAGPAALPAPVKLPKDANGLRWCPDSKCLSMLSTADSSRPTSVSGLVRYDVATGRTTAIPIKSDRIKSVPGSYQWSPSGRYVAFTSNTPTAAKLDLRRGVSIAAYQSAPKSALYTLDVATGTVKQVSPDSLGIVDFDWSPDERAFAVSVREVDDDDGPWYGTDILVIDVASGAVRALVKRPGQDGAPSWSPDGKWIAYTTHDGDRSYNGKWPAFVAAAGGKSTALTSDDTPMGPSISWWSPDSRSFYYVGRYDMAQPLVRVDIEGRRAEIVPHGSSALPFDDGHSASGDGRRIAYTRESMTTPPDLFVATLDPAGRPTGSPLQLTRLHEGFTLGMELRVDTLSWQSKDRKFRIHALLVTPASAWQGDRPREPLPLVLNYIGGPSMVRRGFAADGYHGAHILFATRGYAVLTPNTRGRAGYGTAFERGIRDGKSAARLPYEDAMGGVDLVISRGIADPKQLGVIGHSYGGLLTRYTITATDRFKAAVVHDSHGEGILNRGNSLYRLGSYRELLVRDLVGIHDPFDRKERESLIEETPGLQANRVRTPTLLQYSVQNDGLAIGGGFYNALRRFKVPVAMFLYDEAHVFVRPAAIADDLTRTAEWVDHWVRGMAYPDPTRRAEYEGTR